MQPDGGAGAERRAQRGQIDLLRDVVKVESSEAGGADLHRRSTDAFAERRSIFGVTNHRSMPPPLGGSMSKSIRQMPPFLNARGVRAPINSAASSPRLGSWPTSATRALRTCRVISSITAAGVPAGARASEVTMDGVALQLLENTSAVWRVRTSGLLTI